MLNMNNPQAHAHFNATMSQESRPRLVRITWNAPTGQTRFAGEFIVISGDDRSRQLVHQYIDDIADFLEPHGITRWDTFFSYEGMVCYGSVRAPVGGTNGWGA